MRTFESFAAQGRDNNLNLIRMIAAAAVMVSHSCTLANGGGPEPLDVSTPYTLGGNGVCVFFALSGFLISSSFLRRRSLLDFAVARAARLMPGMAVMYLLVAFVVGPLFTTVGLGTYFADPRLYWGIFGVTSTIDVWMPLPGLFAANPLPVVNGSLWSLPYEVCCYIVTVIAGLIGLLRPRVLLACMLAGAILLLIGKAAGSSIAAKQSFQLIIPFALGVTWYVWRARIPLNAGILAGLAIATFLLRWTVFYREIYTVTLSYGAFWLGGLRVPALLAYNRLGDFSFGFYIYAWPVQEVILVLLPGTRPLPLMGLAAIGTLIPAVLSWHFVEHPALLHRHRIGAWLDRIAGGRLATKKGPGTFAPDPRSGS